MKNIASSQAGNGSKCENRSFPSHTRTLIWSITSAQSATLQLDSFTIKCVRAALIVKVGKFTESCTTCLIARHFILFTSSGALYVLMISLGEFFLYFLERTFCWFPCQPLYFVHSVGSSLRSTSHAVQSCNFLIFTRPKATLSHLFRIVFKESPL